MAHWGRKVFVVLISVLTLGLYIPPTYVTTEAAKNNEVASDDHLKEGTIVEDTLPEKPDYTHPAFDVEEDHIQTIMEQAKEQTLIKMGPRIIEKVDEDMTEEILPKIEEIVETILQQVDQNELIYYEISEEVASGYGEKIFNLYNHHTKEEIARFHVRRDKRPKDGYWFNFHYHLKDDNFTTHHSIGEVYWEKNTPPKWMS